MAAVGTVTISEEVFSTVKKITLAWTCSAGGIVSGTSTTNAFSGKVERLVTVPGTGADAPDDNYNVTVLDEDGTDILMGGGLLRDQVNTEQVLASSLGIVANDKLQLVIGAAGASNKGTVYLYVR